jgi:small subunit ribosomal protein S14
MARNSNIQRELKRIAMVKKYAIKRALLKKNIADSNISENEKWKYRIDLQKLPVNSSPSRLRNRCLITGRSRGVYRKFGLCRNKLREHAMVGDIPGLKKASW